MLRVATYNVHDCVGRDGTYAPERIAAVVADLGAQIVALQEVTLDHAGEIVQQLEELTGMRAVDGTLFERGIGRYGNLLLTGQPIVEQRLHDLSLNGREPRGLVDATLALGDRTCRVAATHLGLTPVERRLQLRRIARLLSLQVATPALLLGDFNVWCGEGALRPLRATGFVTTRVRSYPTWWRPLLSLDRIMARAPAAIVRGWRHERPPVATASDHFPVVADVRVGD